MRHLFKAAAITDQLMDNRDAVRRLLGVKYAERVGPVRVVLRAMAETLHKSLVDCALEAAEKLDAAGQDPSLIFCALVEEIENQ